MRAEFQKTRVYYPEWNDNLKLVKEEQMYVEYDEPNSSTAKRLLPHSKVTFKYDAQGNPMGGEGDIETNDHGIVRGMNIRIRNFEVADGDKVNNIVTADDLFAANFRVQGLIKELATEFSRVLKATVPEKNS